MEFLGLVLLILALAISISLLSFNPHDPSFNTATGTEPTNLLGRAGATIADALVQWLGLGCALPVVLLLAWAWRLVRHHGISALPLRLVAAMLLFPAGATFIGAIQLLLPMSAISWPTENGLGGQVGFPLARALFDAAQGELGAPGRGVALLLVLLLIVILMPLSMGLQWREWRCIGHALYVVVRAPFHLLRPREPRAGRADRDPAPDDYLYEPQPRSSDAPAARSMPTPFLRRSFRQAEPHILPAPFTPPRNAPLSEEWVHPPQSLEAPWDAKPDSAATDGEEEEPSNPYARKLAEIARQPGRTPPPAPSEPMIEEEEFTPPVHPAPDQGRHRLNLFGLNKAEPPAPPHAAPAPGFGPPPAAHGSGWVLPSLDLLRAHPGNTKSGPSMETLQGNARLLESVLSDYGVQGTIGDIHAGPVVTLYELEPAPGIRSSRVIGLSDDIARSLSVLSVRIATVPGRNVIGIEVPNAQREIVYLSALLRTEAWSSSASRLKIALGKDIAGVPVYADLAKMPHLLVAGTTGSGKSVGVNAMILSLLYRLSPEECRLILIDPKILELSVYDGIPHLMTPVVTEPNKAVSALKWTVQEMDRRYRLMAHHQVRNISGYNERLRQLRAAGEIPTRRVQTGFDPETGRPVFDEQRLPLEPLPYIVVVIDEMADLMMVAGKEIETAVQRLAQKARAAGIHVIMATQRPSVDVITGTIKANFPTRISFQVISKFDSRTILQEQGAEQLLGQGDMLFMQGGGRITRVHGPFVSDEEVEAVVADLRSKGEPVYNDDVTSDTEEELSQTRNGNNGGFTDTEGENSLYDQAVELVLREGRASTSFIQRHLAIGYNRAARLIDQMEKDRIIGPANHVGKRDILAPRIADDE